MATLCFQIYFSFQKLRTPPASPVCSFNYEIGENLLPLHTLNSELNKEILPALFTISLSNITV